MYLESCCKVGKTEEVGSEDKQVIKKEEEEKKKPSTISRGKALWIKARKIKYINKLTKLRNIAKRDMKDFYPEEDEKKEKEEGGLETVRTLLQTEENQQTLENEKPQKKILKKDSSSNIFITLYY